MGKPPLVAGPGLRALVIRLRLYLRWSGNLCGRLIRRQ